MKKILLVLFIVLIGGGLFAFKKYRDGVKAQTTVEYEKIVRGDIESVISSTGTIEPLKTVEVGTQVSGTINKIYVDYNDVVKKGQILAVLDTTFLAASVRDAKAGILKAEAQYEKSKQNYDKNLELFKKNYISQFDLINYETDMKINSANLQSARTALERALFNFDHAVIYSPISGTVINRAVEEGQTVAASFSTPTLFSIAEDLSKIEIHALVDESDIGQIKEGQSVRFTVEAYYDKTFTGKVRQVWLQPKTLSNVVTYTVVIDATNDKHLLLPGMTATIDFIIDKRENVLLISNNALRIQPTEEMMKQVFKNKQGQQHSQGSDSTRKHFTTEGYNNGGKKSDIMARLWVEDEKGHFSVIPIRKGLSNGKMTEIIDNGKVHEGMNIISAVNPVAVKKSSQSPVDMRMMGRALRG